MLAWVVILLLALAMSGLLRQVKELQAQVPASSAVPVGLAPGTPAPVIPSLSRRDRPALLLFAEPGCDSCEMVLPLLEDFGNRVDGRACVAAVTREAMPDDHSRGLDVVVESEAFTQYRISFVPAAVMIGRDGIVLNSQPVGSVDRMRDFIRSFEAVAVKGGTS